MTPPANRRYPAIDALRGVSILLVVIHHLAIRIPLRKTAAADVAPRWLLNALSYNGYEAVFIFFVASGFLITHHVYERAGRLSEVDVRDFYARRFARIAPCLIALLVALSLMHAFAVPDFTIDERHSLPRALVAALGLHLNWYEGATGYLPGGWDVLWSLSIEEVFYLAFPWLCRLARRERYVAVALGALALSLPFTRRALRGDEIWMEKAYLPGMAAIATGVLAAMLLHRLGGRVPRPRILVAVGVAGMVAVLTAESALWKYLEDGTMLVETLATAAFLLGASQLSAERPAVPGLLRSWGRLTYEVYLTHMFVVFAVVHAFRAFDGNLRTGFLWYVPLLVLAWLVGALVARGFSLPAERWLRVKLRPPAEPAVGT